MSRLIPSMALVTALMFCGSPALGQSITKVERWEKAQSAYAEQDWETVQLQTAALLDRWPKDEVALLLRAKMLVFGPDVDADAAEKLIGKLPRSIRNDTEVKSISLWIDYFYGVGFMPSVKLMLQQRRANKILEDDELNPLANLVAGSIKLEDYRDQFNAVRLPTGVNLDQVIALMGNALSGGASFIATEGRTNLEIPVIRDDSVELKTSKEAEKLLIRAAATGPLRSFATRQLFETAVRRKDYDLLRATALTYIDSFPNDALGYLGLGLSQFLEGHAAAASVQFEKGARLMDEKDRWAMNNPAQIAGSEVATKYSITSDSANTDYWARKDHLWSSPMNERLVEHRARIVYSDFIWGRPDKNLRGWETEPGNVLIRYGWPKIEMQFQDEDGRYYYLDYGYRYWVFMDLFKSEGYTVWSPPGGKRTADRLCDRGRGGVDMERCSKQWFRDDPERTQRNDIRKVNMLSQPSIFENEGSRTAVVPFCFPSNDKIPGTHVTVFDRKVGNEVPKYGRSILIEEGEKHWSEMPCEVAQVVAHQVDMGARQLSVEVEGLSGFAVTRIDVPAAKQVEGLRLSDLLLARLIEETDGSAERTTSEVSDRTGMSVIRYGTTIYPVARPVFESGTPIFLYLESYGLSQDQESELSFQAALVSGKLDADFSPRISQIFGSRETPVVSVEFTQTVNASLDSRYFILETDDVNPGTYVIAVRVLEKRTGRQEVISREVVIN